MDWHLMHTDLMIRVVSCSANVPQCTAKKKKLSTLYEQLNNVLYHGHFTPLNLRNIKISPFINTKHECLPDKDKEHFASALGLCWKHILAFRRDHLQSSLTVDVDNL